MLFVVLCFVAILMFNLLIAYRRPSKFPPGPLGLPIFGNIFDIQKLAKKTKYYSRVWCYLAEKYGPMVGLKLGLNDPLIIVSGKDAVMEMLTRPEFDGRPNGFLYRYRSGGVRRGIFFTDGDLWVENKRFMLKTLKTFGFGTVTMEEMILRDAKALTNVITKLAKEGPIKNLRHYTSIAVLSSLWCLIAGTRFDIEGKNPKLDEASEMLHHIIRNMNISGGTINQFPFLRHLFPGITGFTTFKKRLSRLTQFFTDIISEHKESRVEGTFRDFIDVYLAEIEKQTSPSAAINDGQLTHVIKDLFSAGIETTSNTIGFVIAYVTVHQNVQKKLHDEIDKIIGKTESPSLTHRKRMPYLNACIAEVGRMANITPTTLPHRALMDTQLLGFTIKKNYNLLPNLRSVHMDKEYWGDPHVFRPERFINEKGEFLKDSWLVTFGLGRRRCLGENLARNSLFLFVACLLQKFHFVLPNGEPTPCLEGIDGFSIAPPNTTVLALERNE